MAAAVDLSSYKEALLVLATAAVVAPLFHRLKLSPIFGFLLMGMALGPDALGRLAASFPVLSWFTVDDREKFAHVGELGVVFLLFMIGLELSLERLRKLWRLIFGMGGAQVVGSALLLGGGLHWLGLEPRDSLVIASCLALSSTALVVQILAEQKRLGTSAGRASFAVLLFQDLAVVPLLALVSVLGAQQAGGLLQALSLALLKAVVAVVLIMIVGRYLLRPLFRLVTVTRSPELFMGASLLVIVGISLLTSAAGLSMALGAFLAGLLLAETEYRRELEVTIEPFKGLLLGVFFFSVGMSVEISRVIAEPLPLIGAVAVLLVLKFLIAYPVLRAFGTSRGAAVESASLLAPAGEFAFVVMGLALTLQVVSPAAGSFTIAVTSLSLALLPLIAIGGRNLARMLAVPTVSTTPSLPDLTDLPVDARVMIVGFGRVGQLIASMLAEQKVTYVAVDQDPVSVAQARRAGRPVQFGNASRAEFLIACGLMSASAVVVTMDDRAAVEAVAREVRKLRPDIVLVARAKDRAHARELYASGVTEAVPEAFEASLHLAEATMIGVGVPLGLAIAAIHERRDLFRAEFQTIDRGDARTQVARLRARQRGVMASDAPRGVAQAAAVASLSPAADGAPEADPQARASHQGKAG